jgi:hypothetical protein
MAKKKKSNALLTLGLLAGGGLLVNEMVKENSGGRSANVNNFFSRQLTTEELKELGNILVSDTRFISSTKGGKGDTGTGIMDLLKIAVPHDSSTPYTKGTVVKTTDSTYLVVDDAPAGTLLTNTAFYYKLHGPDMSGPKGDAFKYSDFTPEQLAALKVKGADGLNAPNWGGSLVTNSSFLEEGITAGFESGGSLEGFPLVNVIVKEAAWSKQFKVNTGVLIKITGLGRASAAGTNINILSRRADGTISVKTSGTSAANLGTLAVGEVPVAFTYFVGGVGTHAKNFAPSTVLGSLVISKANVADSASISRLLVKEVSLGEPVPSNLPWKPEGQIVYDTTTGECGRFNGTTVVWFGA